MMLNFDLNEKQSIHFIGIGGISMSGLASILLSRGFDVTGSDSKESELICELRDKGAKIYIGQSGENISDDTKLVVYTAAIHEDNPELKRARELNIPCMARAQFLGILMKNYQNAICVSGTHGKTTTTSFISKIMIDSLWDPTVLVGGMFSEIGGNLRIGESSNFITEACEYTNSFLEFFPTVGVILNVKADHLDFFKDLDDIRSSFKKYAQLLPKDGILIINGEIENLSYFTDDLKCKVVTFGLNGEFDFTAKNITYGNDGTTSYDVYKNGEKLTQVKIRLIGEHNVYDSLAAFATAYSLGVKETAISESISKFTGVDRRFQLKGEVGGVTVIDDYAHHPDEIRATLTGAKNYPHKKLWVVFQPHTYTRTIALMDEFVQALRLADAVVLAEIYAAREKNTTGISSRDIMEKLKKEGKECYYFPTFDEIENFLLENCVNGDLLITMGAGDVVNIGEKLLGR